MIERYEPLLETAPRNPSPAESRGGIDQAGFIHAQKMKKWGINHAGLVQRKVFELSPCKNPLDQGKVLDGNEETAERNQHRPQSTEHKSADVPG